MVANPQRRTEVLDGALALLGREGSRSLTHRAVDREVGVPGGTTANYFSTRAALLLGTAERIFERLAPSEELQAALERKPSAAAYVANVVERLLAEPYLATALIELRLEAARSTEVYDVLGPFLRDGLAADVAFHKARGLPGGRRAVIALHHLVNGVVLDHLTVPLDPGADPARTAARITRQLIESH